MTSLRWKRQSSTLQRRRRYLMRTTDQVTVRNSLRSIVQRSFSTDRQKKFSINTKARDFRRLRSCQRSSEKFLQRKENSMRITRLQKEKWWIIRSRRPMSISWEAISQIRTNQTEAELKIKHDSKWQTISISDVACLLFWYNEWAGTATLTVAQRRWC